MEAQYAVVMVRSHYDYEIIPVEEVPRILLDFPGRSGLIPSLYPGELYRVLSVGADKNELERLAGIDIAYQLDEVFSTIVQPHKYRKKG